MSSASARPTPAGDARAGPTLAGRSASEIALLLRAALEVRSDLWVRCAGISMWPTIADGDEVLLVAPPRTIRRGDVVLVHVGACLVLHRVRAVGGGALHLIGDAHRLADPPCALDRVLAQAVAVRGAKVAALVPTLRFGLGPLLRWAGTRLRLMAARGWRSAVLASPAARAAASRRAPQSSR